MYGVTRLTICLLTYNRFDYAHKTLQNVLENTTYTNGTLHVHIADDGSPGDYVDRLRYLAGCYDKVASVSHSITERKGYGGNFNRATNIIHDYSDYVLPLEDDWVLTAPLDLNPIIQDMQSDSDIQCIRLAPVGWTFQQLAEFVGVNFRTYLHLLPESTNQYVFSGNPRVESVLFERSVGLWPESLSPGQTEISVMGRTAARTGIYVPMWCLPPFKTIGDIKSEW